MSRPVCTVMLTVWVLLLVRIAHLSDVKLSEASQTSMVHASFLLDQPSRI